MWSKKSSLSCFSIILLLFLLQACAGRLPLVKDNLKSISAVTVVRHQTPTIGLRTVGSGVLLGLGGIVTAPVGASMEASGGKEVQEKGGLPDFGELVMLKFAERVPKEIPEWPEIKTENRPVPKDYQYKDADYLEFKIQELTIITVSGLLAVTNVTMFNKKGKVIWRDHFRYTGIVHHKEHKGKNKEYWEADNYKILKEEMLFAADYTVSEFIKAIKTEKLIDEVSFYDLFR